MKRYNLRKRALSLFCFATATCNVSHGAEECFIPEWPAVFSMSISSGNDSFLTEKFPSLLQKSGTYAWEVGKSLGSSAIATVKAYPGTCLLSAAGAVLGYKSIGFLADAYDKLIKALEDQTRATRENTRAIQEQTAVQLMVCAFIGEVLRANTEALNGNMRAVQANTEAIDRNIEATCINTLTKILMDGVRMRHAQQAAEDVLARLGAYQTQIQDYHQHIRHWKDEQDQRVQGVEKNIQKLGEEFTVFKGAMQHPLENIESMKTGLNEDREKIRLFGRKLIEELNKCLKNMSVNINCQIYQLKKDFVPEVSPVVSAAPPSSSLDRQERLSRILASRVSKKQDDA